MSRYYLCDDVTRSIFRSGVYKGRISISCCPSVGRQPMVSQVCLPTLAGFALAFSRVWRYRARITRRSDMFRRQRTSGIIVCLMGLSCLGLGVLASTPASAQVSGATITGTVSDPVGAVILRAQVSIRNLATGEERSVSTDTAGLYTLPNLSPSKYQVTVTALGFSTKVLSGVTLTVGAQQLLNVTMDVGQISQKVEVSSEAPTVQLASSDISGVVGESAVVDLPLNGRDWTSLAILQPGVDSVSSIQANTATHDRAIRGYGAELAIS